MHLSCEETWMHPLEEGTRMHPSWIGSGEVWGIKGAPHNGLGEFNSSPTSSRAIVEDAPTPTQPLDTFAPISLVATGAWLLITLMQVVHNVSTSH